MPIPEWYHPINDADPEAFTQAVDQQLSLAESAYDPTGMFAQRREASWVVHASQDTRGMQSLPAIYQSEETSVTVYASANKEGAVRVSLGVTTDPDIKPDMYSSRVDEELPIIVALLGKIANIELAELEAHPRRAIRALSESSGTSIGFERDIAQKSLELPGISGGAMNLTYFKTTGSMGMCDARLARQVELPEGVFLYQQNIIADSRNPDTLYCWPRAFILRHSIPMGEAYDKERADRIELVDWTTTDRRQIYKSDFETRLRQAGNALVGIVQAADVSRIVSEPISAEYRLQV